MSPAATQQQQGPGPGQLFRVPRYTTQKRFVLDANNTAIATTLNAGSTVQAQTTKLDQLDILRNLLVQVSLTEVYTPGSGKTITQSTLFPYTWLGEVSVQFESAFKTFRQPGVLAFVMQGYRPTVNPKGVATLTRAGSNTQSDATSYTTAALTPTPSNNGLTGPNVTDATSPLNLAIEIPLAYEFDVYYELDAQGNPIGQVQRAIVSPQYMAATTRSVRPIVNYNAAMLAQTGGAAIQAPATIASTDATSTFAGVATLNIWRDGWFAPDSPAKMPPIYQWQYSRDYITQATSGQSSVIIPLDADPAGQGQILSLIAFVWDPTLNSGIGGVTPASAIAGVELLFGSHLDIAADTIFSNSYRWLQQHGILLPPGWFGWDLALDESGRITNEFALNTLITAGCQVRITFVSGSAPASTATVYVGLEMLKKVSS